MKKVLKFHAQAVHVQDDGQELSVGFADSASRARSYLMLERDPAPESQDVELGHDDVPVEINDQRHSGYGGVAGCWLYPALLRVKLKPEAAAKMGVADEVEVAFAVDEKRLRKLRQVVKKILAGKAEFEEETAREK